MKRPLLILLSLVLCTITMLGQIDSRLMESTARDNDTTAQIRFIKGGWEEALRLAQQSGKMIYALVSARNCAACAKLKRMVLTDPEVARFYNRNFICYTLDDEPDDTVALRLQMSQWRVTCYPTQIFLDPRGEVLHRVCGIAHPSTNSLTVAALYNASDALDTATQSVRLNDSYERGQRDPDFLLRHALAAELSHELIAPSLEDLAREYFATQSMEELSSERNWQAFRAILRDVTSREYGYLLRHLDELAAQHGWQDVLGLMLVVCRRHASERSSTPTPKDRQLALQAVDSILPYIRARFGCRDSRMQSKLMDVYSVTFAWDRYAEAAFHLFDSAGVSDDVVVMQVARTIYGELSDPTLLQAAERLVLAAIAQRDDFLRRRLYVQLLHKQGKHEEARRAVDWALELAAEKQGDDLRRLVGGDTDATSVPGR